MGATEESGGRVTSSDQRWRRVTNCFSKIDEGGQGTSGARSPARGSSLQRPSKGRWDTSPSPVEGICRDLALRSLLPFPRTFVYSSEPCSLYTQSTLRTGRKRLPHPGVPERKELPEGREAREGHLGAQSRTMRSQGIKWWALGEPLVARWQERRLKR